MKKMKTELFILLVLALGAVSCGKMETAGNAGEGKTCVGGAVSFESSLPEDALTRASVSYLDSLKSDGFLVWANVREDGDAQDEKFMNSQSVTWDADSGQWTYSPVKLWPTGESATLDFYAVYLDGTDNVSTTWDWYNRPRTTFRVPDTVSEQSDLLWAAPLLDVDAQDYARNDRAINFTFRHALSGFRFSCRLAAEPDTGTTVTVDSVSLTGYFAATAVVLPQKTVLSEALSLQGDWVERTYTISKDRDDEVNTAVSSGDGLTTSPQLVSGDKGIIMVLPFAHEYTLTLNYTVTNAGSTTGHYVSSRTVTDPELVSGKMLDIEMVLTPTEVPVSSLEFVSRSTEL